MAPVYGTTLVDHRVFVLGEDQEVLDGTATFEVGPNAISPTDLFDTFTKTLCIGYGNVALGFNFIGGSLGISSALVVNPINYTTLNNNIGKFNLLHIWDRILLDTKSLNLKRHINNNNTQPNQFKLINLIYLIHVSINILIHLI